MTVAAPCILPLLPVIIGGSLTPGVKPQRQWLRPLIITASLAVSIIIFTLLLKATTALLGLPIFFWQVVSGLIVTLLGLHLLFPHVWEKFVASAGIYSGSSKLLSTSYQKNGSGRDILVGASLGPVFSSCSPTYALIVAAVLPVSFAKGLTYLVAYALGLGVMMLLIAYAGQAFVRKLGWLSNPGGWFRKVIGVLFVVVGLSVGFGIDKKIQAYVLEKGWYDPISNLERRLEN